MDRVLDVWTIKLFVPPLFTEHLLPLSSCLERKGLKLQASLCVAVTLIKCLDFLHERNLSHSNLTIDSIYLKSMPNVSFHMSDVQYETGNLVLQVDKVSVQTNNYSNNTRVLKRTGYTVCLPSYKPIPFGKGSTLKRKDMLPFGANSFLKDIIVFRTQLSSLKIIFIYFDQMVDRIYPTELQLIRANSSDTETPFFIWIYVYLMVQFPPKFMINGTILILI